MYYARRFRTCDSNAARSRLSVTLARSTFPSYVRWWNSFLSSHHLATDWFRHTYSTRSFRTCDSNAARSRLSVTLARSTLPSYVRW